MRAELLVLAGLIGGCAGAPSIGDAGPPEPGISGGALSGRVEIVTVDEATRTVQAQPYVSVSAPGLSFRSGFYDEPPYVFEDVRLAGAISIAVPGRSLEQWIGVRGSRIVLPMPSVPAPVFARVRGASTGDGSSATAIPLVPLRITRPSIDLSTGIEGAVEAAGVRRFDFTTGAGSIDVLVLLRDASRAPAAFAVIRDVQPGGANAVDVSDPSQLVATATLELDLPAPPEGLDAVVGVPGLATGGGVGAIGAPIDAPGTVVVPDLAGELDGATIWVIATATSSSDPGARAVVVQRGLRSPADVGAWPAFLALPSAETVDGGLALAPVPGASLYVVEWLDPSCRGCESVGTSLVLDPAVHLTAEGTSATHARVRAIDAGPIDPSEVSLAAIDRAAIRWSEIVVER